MKRVPKRTNSWIYLVPIVVVLGGASLARASASPTFALIAGLVAMVFAIRIATILIGNRRALEVAAAQAAEEGQQAEPI